MNTGNKLLFFFVIFSFFPFLTGCLPVIIAAGAGASYLSTTPEALAKVDAYFADIDRSIQRKFNKTSTESQTKKQLEYKKSQGLIIELVGYELSPKEVKPGDKVTVTIQYAVLGATSDSGIEVEENKTLWFGDHQTAVLANDKVSRKNGTWESVLTFQVPVKVQAGKYKVKQSISSNDKVFQTFDSFEIASK